MLVVGDGLAGLLLAQRLVLPVVGDGRSNTPPVGLMHLFQGRSFRRDLLEVEAFERSVAFWSGCDFAREFSVRRAYKRGDRLDRSAEACQVPLSFRPRREAQNFVYGPGFVVECAALSLELAGQLQLTREHLKEFPVGCVVATGLGLAELLPGGWDRSHGRLVTGKGPSIPSILIGFGAHLAPADGGVVIGGRSVARAGSVGDELEIAGRLTSHRYQEQSIWRGQKLAWRQDRWPVMGWWEGRFFFGGFGSRALFWLPYCLDLAERAWLQGHNRGIPERLSVDRIRLPR